jgi:hypothetical protein
MKSLVVLVAVGAATTLNGQSLPDCRTPTLPLNAQCTFSGSTLPTQVYMGDIALPSSDHVRMTQPFVLHTVPPPVGAKSVYPFMAVGGMFTVQSETLGYKALVSSGGKGFAMKQWSDWRGIEMRGTAVELGLGTLGFLAGNNHTVSGTIGPRVQHPFGRVTPYAGIQIGVLHQYYYGMSEGALFGSTVRVSKRVTWVAADVEYRYATFQDSTRYANPRRGRIELSTGLAYTFGHGN